MFTNNTHRRARKEHKCCECKTEIERGESYWHISTVQDGSWSDFKQCNFCYEVAESAVDYARSENMPDEHYPIYGQLRDFIYENDSFMLSVWPLETWQYFVDKGLASDSQLRMLL